MARDSGTLGRLLTSSSSCCEHGIERGAREESSADVSCEVSVSDACGEGVEVEATVIVGVGE
eukprot:scaffold12300_cov132-Isochrysis_galbana.AAC.4